MFKIAKLKQLDNEIVDITKYKQEVYYVKTKEKKYTELLEFEITGSINKEKYNYSFEIDEEFNNYFNYHKLEKINLNTKVREEFLNCNNKNMFISSTNIELIRCTDNIYNMNIILIIDEKENLSDDLIITIEFSFNINEIKEKQYETH